MVLARLFSALIAALAAGAVFAAAGLGGSEVAVVPSLYVNYGSTNCTFTIVGDSGANVTTIAPGTYQVLISENDLSSCNGGLPDFELDGPGVSIDTPVDTGDGNTAEFDATFQPSSTYVAMDGNAPALSRITFTTQASGSPAAVSITTSAPSAPTTSTGGTPASSVLGSSEPKALVLRGTLDGVVGTGGTLRLALDGKAVTTLTAGRYKVTVVDHSKTSGLIIQESGKAASTVAGIAFVGKRSTTIALSAGQWFYYPTFVGKKTYFVVVT